MTDSQADAAAIRTFGANTDPSRPADSAGIDIALNLQRPDFLLDIRLQVPHTGITVLWGPSGCGKTSTLRCIAGLDRAHGHVKIGNGVWQDDAQAVFVPTWQRDLGYVFQEAGLFPHLSVDGNLRYGLKRSKKSGGNKALDQAIDLLGIRPLLSRSPDTLSGGERQRVAIARALAMQPQLLLLDEPLASLDPARRGDILPWLERVRDEAGVPALYVTHSSDELARLADHVLVMEQGQVKAAGTLATVLSRTDVARSAGEEAGVLLHAQLIRVEAHEHLALVKSDAGEVWVRHHADMQTKMRLRILARDVSLATRDDAASSIQNRLQGVIESIGDDVHPSQKLVTVMCGNARLLSRVTQRALTQLHLSEGQTVWCQIKTAAVIG